MKDFEAIEKSYLLLKSRLPRRLGFILFSSGEIGIVIILHLNPVVHWKIPHKKDDEVQIKEPKRKSQVGQSRNRLVT